MTVDLEKMLAQAGYDHALLPDLARVLGDTKVSWQQAVSDISILLTEVLLACENGEMRMTVAERITDKMLEVCRSGKLPDEVLQ